MATLDKTVLIPVDVEENFSDSLLLSAYSITTGVPPSEITRYEQLEFISLSADQDIGNLIIMAMDSGNNLSISISGSHKLSIFDQNEIKTITRGSSDLIEPPLTSDSFDDLDPEEKQCFSYVIDPRFTITINYTLTYRSTFDGLSSFETVDFTQVVSNDWDRYIPTFLTFI